MSAAAQTARPRPTGSRASSVRPPLAVVASPHPKHSRSLFVAVVALLLGLGLAALLTMNTMLAQDAFVASSLQQRNAELAVTEQALAARVAAHEDPQALAARAWALGLRPSGTPVFLRLPDGKVLGAHAASAAGSGSRP